MHAFNLPKLIFSRVFFYRSNTDSYSVYSLFLPFLKKFQPFKSSCLSSNYQSSWCLHLPSTFSFSKIIMDFPQDLSTDRPINRSTDPSTDRPIHPSSDSVTNPSHLPPSNHNTSSTNTSTVTHTNMNPSQPTLTSSINHFTDPSMSPSTNHSFDQSINRSLQVSIDRPNNKSINKANNKSNIQQSTKQSIQTSNNSSLQQTNKDSIIQVPDKNQINSPYVHIDSTINPSNNTIHHSTITSFDHQQQHTTSSFITPDRIKTHSTGPHSPSSSSHDSSYDSSWHEEDDESSNPISASKSKRSISKSSVPFPINITINAKCVNVVNHYTSPYRRRRKTATYKE